MNIEQMDIHCFKSILILEKVTYVFDVTWLERQKGQVEYKNWINKNFTKTEPFLR